MHALEELQAVFETELLFVESGGDNLAGEWGYYGFSSGLERDCSGIAAGSGVSGKSFCR